MSLPELDPSKFHFARWRILFLVSLAEMLAISVWLVSSAISPELKELWNLTDWQSGALTTAVQIGFVAGTLMAAIFNLADIFPNRYYFAICALLTSVANAMLLFCDGFSSALLARFLVGFFLAGVYPPAMKMIATWFQSGRGFAIGTVVGALTLGKAVPFLLKAFQLTQWRSVLIVSSLCALLAAVLIFLLYRDGPFRFERRPFSFTLITDVIADQKTRLAIGGYLGHMWELYAMWTWISFFMIAAAQEASIESQSLVDGITFLIIAVGAVGCVIGGQVADRVGREWLVNFSMVVSGLCCLLIGLSFGVSFWLCTAVALVWGFFVVADSAQFSTMVTEVCPNHAVGTALTLQTSIGFLLTTVSIQLVPIFQERVGWQFTFAFLALGPAAGIMAIRKLAKVRRRDLSVDV